MLFVKVQYVYSSLFSGTLAMSLTPMFVGKELLARLQVTRLYAPVLVVTLETHLSAADPSRKEISALLIPADQEQHASQALTGYISFITSSELH